MKYPSSVFASEDCSHTNASLWTPTSWVSLALNSASIFNTAKKQKWHSQPTHSVGSTGIYEKDLAIVITPYNTNLAPIHSILHV